MGWHSQNSCHGPGWKHPCLGAAWGWNSLVVWRSVLEACHLVPVVISDPLPCAPCVSEPEKQLCWLGQVWSGNPAPQQESLLCCLFSSPALLQVGAHPAQSSNHQVKSWTGCGWEWGDTLGSPCTGNGPGTVFGCSAPRGQLGKTAPFVPLHCDIGMKMGGDNYCIAHPCSPSLGRKVALLVTA